MDEAYRIVDEAQHAAEIAKKALEDTQAKQSQPTAYKLHLRNPCPILKLLKGPT
jgi:hypothetical protein